MSRTSSVARGVAVPATTVIAAVPPADRDLVALDDAGDADARARCGTRRPAGSSPSSRARGRGDRLGDRMLGRGLDRAGEAQDLARGRAVERHDVGELHPPSVTVPVLSSTIVSIRRVCSRISGPLIRMPSCAPRPVPTISAVGVASPSAHGQAMISTATAAVNACRGRGAEQRASPASVASEITITTGTKTAETRSASRCTGALPDCAVLDEPRDLRERRVGADLRRADDEPAVRVDRRAGDLGSRPDLDRHRLAGQQRLVDRRLALDDDAVGRDLLAGPDDEQVADLELVDRNEHLVAVAQHARLLRAQLEQRADRLARAALARAPRGSGRAGSAS